MRHLLEIGVGHHRINQDSVTVDLLRGSEADIIASVHTLPFRSDQFKRTVIYETLEHLRCPVKALEEIRRVSLSLTLSVPNRLKWRVFMRFLLRKRTYVTPEHIYSWTIGELENILGVTNWTVVWSGYGTWRHYHKRSPLERIFPHLVAGSLFVKCERK